MSRLSFLVCNSTLHSKGLFNQNLVGFSQRDLCHPHQKDLKIFYQVDSHLEDCSNCGSSSNEAAIQQCSILTNQSHSYWQMDDEPFNPDYVEVDRVLDVSESTDENGEVWLLSHPSTSIILKVSVSHNMDYLWFKALSRYFAAVKMSVRPPPENVEKCENCFG